MTPPNLRYRGSLQHEEKMSKYRQEIIERNQIWKHHKGNKYKIYGIANDETTNQKYVLYYQTINDYTFELVYGGGYVVHSETLQRMMMTFQDIYNPLGSLMIKSSFKDYLFCEEEIQDLKDIGCNIVWARPFDNFFETITKNDRKIIKFQPANRLGDS